jgi:hypothetical protein
MMHAQASAVPFYERLGWRAVGAPFEEAGIAHRAMVLLPDREDPRRDLLIWNETVYGTPDWLDDVRRLST